MYFGAENSEKVTFNISDTEFKRSREVDTRFFNKIPLKLNEDTYNELEKFIEFRGEKDIVLLDSKRSIPKHTLTKIERSGWEWGTLNSSDWDKAKERVHDKMTRVTFEIGLV